MTAAPIVVTPQSGRDLLRSVKPRLKVGSTFLCLRPDLLDAWAEEQEKLQQIVAEDVSRSRLAGGKQQSRSRAATAQAKVVQALEEQIEQVQLRFTMTAMEKPQYRLLKDNNPPRENNQIDLFAGYNTEAVRDQMVRECIIDPVFEDCLDDGCNHFMHAENCTDDCTEHGDCGTWEAFLLVCNPSEWEELQRLAEEVNGRVGGLPKSVLAANLLERRSTARRSPANGE